MCLILPTFPVCNGSLPLVVFPPALPMCMCGVLIALCATAATRAAVERRGQVLLILVRMLGAGAAVSSLAYLADGGGAPAILTALVGTVVAVAVPWRGGEGVVVAVALLVALTSAVMMTAIAADPRILYGAQVTAVLTWGLVAGTTGWACEVWWAKREDARWQLATRGASDL